jgi:acyl carrier protein
VSDVDARLTELFRQILDEPTIELTDDVRFADLPGWDSLVHVNTMFSLEEAFGVTFVGDEFGQLHTVQRLKESLRSKGAVPS